MTAAAAEASAASRYSASSTKTRLSLFADCRLETLVTVTELSPRRWQLRFSARSRRVRFMAVYCRFTGRKCTTRIPICRELVVAGCGRVRPGRGRAPSPPHERHHTSALANRAVVRLGGGFSSGDAPTTTGRDIGGRSLLLFS